MSIERLNPTELKALELILNKGNRTFDEISTELEISPRHLRRIREKPDFKQALKDSAVSASAEDINDVMKALSKRAKSGDVKAMQLFVQVHGLIVEKKEVKSTTTVEDVSSVKQMSNEDIEAEIRELQEMAKKTALYVV